MNFKRFFSKMKYIILALKKRDDYQLIEPCYVLIIGRENNKGESLEGKKYSKYLDTIGDYFASRGHKVQQMFYPYSFMGKDECWGSPYTYNRIQFINRFIDILLDRVGAPFRKSPYSKHYLQKRYYRQILKKTEPKCIFAIWSDPDLCYEARQLNIPVVEVLHGLGYPRIPWGWDKEHSLYLPNYIISFDDISSTTFSELTNKNQIIVRQINNVWLNRFEVVFKDIGLPDEWNFIPKLKCRKKNILITLQWGYDGYHPSFNHFDKILSNGVLAEEVIEVIESTQEEINWFLRLHPLQMTLPRYRDHKEFVAALALKYNNVEWKEASSKPLPSVLNHCDGHITMISMTAYEAAYMKVPTLLLCPTLNSVNKDYYCDLINSGYAQKANFKDKVEIFNWVMKTDKKDKPFNSTPTHSWKDLLQELEI